jgi:hypothetical protein
MHLSWLVGHLRVIDCPTCYAAWLTASDAQDLS